MRAWTKSACVVLAWSILSIMLVTVHMTESVHPAQANTRTASSTQVTLASALSVAAVPVTTTSPSARYVVQPGDTLSGIAARFSVRGGWPVLYAADRQVVGPDPNTIHPGTVLVLPGQTAPVRYTVAAGDTLSRIAAEFAVRGGWPALYAANRSLVGPDPNTIHPGTVLTVPSPTAPSPPTPRPAYGRPHPAPPSPPAGHRHHPRPVARRAPAATGMPQWLKIMLLAVGLLILVAFLAGPVLAARGRRRQAAGQALQLGRAELGQAELGQKPEPRQIGAEKAHIILADHDRLIVTRNNRDNTVCVLRRPDEDPMTILRVARLVMPEGPYEELAEQLGLPANWPMK
jgi:LysM repeat protein